MLQNQTRPRLPEPEAPPSSSMEKTGLFVTGVLQECYSPQAP